MLTYFSTRRQFLGQPQSILKVSGIFRSIAIIPKKLTTRKKPRPNLSNNNGNPIPLTHFQSICKMANNSSIFVDACIEVVDDADRPIKLNLSCWDMRDYEENYSDEEESDDEEEEVIEFPVGLSGKALVDWLVDYICNKMIANGIPESVVNETKAEIRVFAMLKIYDEMDALEKRCLKSP